jgi:hypothetical protein
MDGVRVTRDDSGAVIAHDCAPVVAVRLELGPHVRSYSDDDILRRYTHHVSALGAALIASPQLRWDEVARRWLPRGRAICCHVEAGIDAHLVVIDGLELTLAELAAMLSGHGARVCVVFLDD